MCSRQGGVPPGTAGTAVLQQQWQNCISSNPSAFPSQVEESRWLKHKNLGRLPKIQLQHEESLRSRWGGRQAAELCPSPGLARCRSAGQSPHPGQCTAHSRHAEGCAALGSAAAGNFFLQMDSNFSILLAANRSFLSLLLPPSKAQLVPAEQPQVSLCGTCHRATAPYRHLFKTWGFSFSHASKQYGALLSCLLHAAFFAWVPHVCVTFSIWDGGIQQEPGEQLVGEGAARASCRASLQVQICTRFGPFCSTGFPITDTRSHLYYCCYEFYPFVFHCLIKFHINLALEYTIFSSVIAFQNSSLKKYVYKNIYQL